MPSLKAAQPGHQADWRSAPATVRASHSFWWFNRVALAKYAPTAYAYRWAALRGSNKLLTSTMMNEIARAYLDCMSDLRDLLIGIDRTLSKIESRKEYSSDAYAATMLLFRQALEIIVFSSLSANRQHYSAIYSDFSTHWNAKRLLRNIRKLNPDFYPKPLSDIRDEHGHLMRLEPIKTGYLTQDEFIELYNDASAALHQPNPFQSANDHSFRLTFTEWYNRILILMGQHGIKLLDNKDWWFVQLSSAQRAGKSRLFVVHDAYGKDSTFKEEYISER